MTKVKEEVGSDDYYKEIHFLYEILNSLKGKEEIKLFFKDMLTKSELIMLKRRWHIATLLASGLDLRSVAMMSRTSTQTVSRIKNVLEEGLGGLQTAIARTTAATKKKKPLRGSKFVKGWFE